MVYYTSNNMKIEYNINKDAYIKSGTQGSVYKYDDSKCIKIYHDDDIMVMRKDIYEIINSLNLDNYCKIYDLLFDKTKKNILGYIMKYYKSTSNNILFMPMDYTLDNVNILYKSIVRLSEHNIKINDLFHGNIILGDNDITIIDYDTYDISNFSTKTLTEINASWLLFGIKSVYQEALTEIGVDPNDQYYYLKLSDIFKECIDVPKTLSKKLNSYNIPIEAIYKKESI